jgi:hypothetical protein
MADNPTKANLIAKILFIAGGIILFIVLVLFIFRIVPVAVSNLSNFTSNIFSGINRGNTDEEIQVTTDNDTVDVQNPVLVSFVYEPGDVVGQYHVSYSCVDGLFFDIQSKDGPKRIICDTPLRLGSNINAISLTPLFTKQIGFVDSTLTISYRDAQSNILASGTKTITIKEDEATATPEENPYEVNGTLSGSTVTTTEVTPVKTTPTTTYTNPTTGTYTQPTKDLVITYIAPSVYDSSFVMYVYNHGNTPTGPWEFTYTDAENPSQLLLSPVQASLGKGQGLAVTVRFDGQNNSRQTIFVVVDPYNRIAETNESNNSASVVITGDPSGSNGGGSYNPNDDADLVITSMEVGRLSGSRFIEDDEVDEGDSAAVRFVVKNKGGESTGSWRFEIDNLPFDEDDTYRSKSYSSLRPGESIEIIVEFNNVDEGRYSIRVEVDSDDDVDEEDESNNTKSRTLEVNN